jgi:hypothetical protein
MHTGKIAAAGILVLSAVGLSACNGDDPATTGSTNPPAVQSQDAPSQAMPTPTEDPNAAPASGTDSNG